jgi:hypothetical protein
MDQSTTRKIAAIAKIITEDPDVNSGPGLNFYSVKKLSDSPSGTYAFAVNPYNYEIVLGKSGHGTILRNYDKQDFCEGGWVYLDKRKLIFNCGSLGNVRDKQGVKIALETYFNVRFDYSR